MLAPVARRFDHGVILVQDLDRQAAAYQRLGFTVTPRMFHPFGTANNLIMFQSNFLELLGVAGTSAISGIGETLRQQLEDGEGLSAVALSSDDVEADKHIFAENGLNASDVTLFRRHVHLPNGEETDAVVTVCLLDAGARRSGAMLFVSRQHVPEATWVPEWQVHENGARDVVSLTMVVENPSERYKASFFTMLGEAAVSGEASSLAAKASNTKIEVVSPETFRDRNEALGLGFDAPSRLGMATIAVANLNRLAAMLADRGVTFGRRSDGNVVVGPEYSAGLVLEFCC